MNGPDLIAAWQATVASPAKSWVLFENGTCVILLEPEEDLAAQATALLREYGPVHPRSSFGDFETITLDNGLGWVVASHHTEILTSVGPDELEADSSDLVIGLHGRSKRGQDAEDLRVLHIEDGSET